MSNVLFIEKGLTTEKQGLMYLSAVLKQRGHTVDLVQTDEEDVFSVVDSFKPDYFAYSVCTGEHRNALAINRQLKQRYPHADSIWGGAHPTFFPEMINEEGVDYLVVGQGERAILEIVGGGMPKGVVKMPLIEDLGELPPPDRDLIYKYLKFRDNPMKNVLTQRDCPYSCSYCHNHLWRDIFKGETARMFQRKSVDKTIDEIREMQEKYGLEAVLFQDDNFIGVGNDGREWMNEFCERYTESIGLPFLCCMRVNLIDEEMIKKLKNAGLKRVHFSIESANPEVRDKLLHRGQITNHDVEVAVKLFRKYGIASRLQNMIGLPLENPLEDALDTLKFSLDNQADESWVTIYQPYPKTQLGQYCLDNGFIEGDLLDSCANSYFDESRLNIPDRDKIQRLQRWWHFITKYSLPIEFVKDVLLEVPLSDESKQLMIDMKVQDAKKNFLKMK